MATTNQTNPDQDLAADKYLPGGSMPRFENVRSRLEGEPETSCAQGWQSTDQGRKNARKIQSPTVYWFSSALQPSADPVRSGWYLVFYASTPEPDGPGTPLLRIGPVKCGPHRLIDILIDWSLKKANGEEADAQREADARAMVAVAIDHRIESAARSVRENDQAGDEDLLSAALKEFETTSTMRETFVER